MSAVRRAITTEDRYRATDRRHVGLLRSRNRRWLLLLTLIGPGILVMLGENDAPSMLSYAAAGAQFGVSFFLPFVVLTFAMAYVVQEMTVRLGVATHRGHAELIFDRFGPYWGWFAMADLTLGNFLTLVTEFIGVRAGLGFFGVPPLVAVASAVGVVILASLSSRYWTWERLTLGLAVFNLIFIPVALMAHPDWGAVGHALLTWGPLPGGLNANTLLLVVASIGATVTPWMLFFQQSAVADKGLTKEDLKHGRIDTALGALLAAVAACATIIATVPLFLHHISAQNFQAAQFAQALEPYVGHVAAALFALGIFEAGMVAAITISSSSAYAFGEVARTARSLNRPLREGLPFYAVLFLIAAVAGALVLIPGAPLEYIVLIVNVIAVLAMPPALIFLFLLCRDRDVVGELTSSWPQNVLISAVVVFLTGAGLFFAVTTLFPHLLPSA